MKEKLVLERYRQTGTETLTFTIMHGSFVQIPHPKFKKRLQWIKAEDCRITTDEPVQAERTLWIEDDKGMFVGVFNSVDEYIMDMKRFYGQTKIAVKEQSVINPQETH